MKASIPILATASHGKCPSQTHHITHQAGKGQPFLVQNYTQTPTHTTSHLMQTPSSPSEAPGISGQLKCRLWALSLAVTGL